MVRIHRQFVWNSLFFRIAIMGSAVVYGLALARLSLLNSFLLLFFSLVSVGALIEPLVGLLATLFVGILWAWLRAELPAVPPLISMPLLALTLGAWLMRGAARRELRLRAVPLRLPLLLFIGAAAFSLWDGVELTLYGVPELIKWVQILALFWLVADHVDARRLPWLVGGLLFIGVFQAAMGLWQFGLRGTGPEHYAIDSLGVLRGNFYRAYGTFEQPNPYAGYLGLVFPLGLGLLAAGAVECVERFRLFAPPSDEATASRNSPPRKGEPSSPPWGGEPSFPPIGEPVPPVLSAAEGSLPKETEGGYFYKLVALLAVTGLLGAALLASWSRGAWLGAGAGVLAMLAALPRRGWLGLGLVALLLVGTLGLDVVGLLPASVSARLTDFTQYARFEDVRGVGINDANYAVIERLAHWQAALEMWRANFWNGVGFGDYEPAYADYRLLNWPIALGHAHNYYLNVAAETGAIGLLAYLLLWGAVFWQTWRVTRQAVGWRRGLAIGLLGAWTHFSVHHLFDNLYVNNVHLHVGVMLGLAALLAQDGREPAASRRHTPQPLSPPSTND